MRQNNTENVGTSQPNQELTTVQARIKKILALFPHTRNNDKELMFCYWVVYDGLNETNFATEFVQRATSPETITRARRRIQEEGLYVPSEITIAKRRHREEAYRTFYGSRE